MSDRENEIMARGVVISNDAKGCWGDMAIIMGPGLIYYSNITYYFSPLVSNIIHSRQWYSNKQICYTPTKPPKKVFRAAAAPHLFMHFTHKRDRSIKPIRKKETDSVVLCLECTRPCTHDENVFPISFFFYPPNIRILSK